jgi:transposase
VSVSKFTPENRGALLERFAAGLSLRDAARAADLSQQTVKGWLARGRKESEGEYHDFARAVEEARSSAAARPAPMDAAELAQVVSKMARAGSVQAAKLRWEMLREQVSLGSESNGPLAEVDELARRRERR